MALALLPISASAHARLLASSPLPGAVLDAIPSTVILDFSEPVTAAGRGISVYGPDGRLAGVGGVRTQGAQMSVGVAPSAAQGTFAVVWTVVSEDTHPSRGEFTFSVGHASPVRAPGFGGDVGLASPVGLALQALGRWLHFVG
ncbi:MAG TPA: copper resistance protein CopC, partial [Candidatus Sulfotelmatobacter sp.]|nr:copper resistance protein CopC [Candidatus Sulfotelmatobacter sp.]